MSDERKPVVVCHPVTPEVRHFVTDDSTPDAFCTVCSCQCWFSASTKIAITNQGFKLEDCKVLCLSCFIKLKASTDEELEVAPPAEEQLEAIKNTITRRQRNN